MLKNITLSAEENLIRRAREKARRENTSLNSVFRSWLSRYVSSDKKLINFDDLMDSLSYAHPGKKFSREQLNER